MLSIICKVGNCAPPVLQDSRFYTSGSVVSKLLLEIDVPFAVWLYLNKY